MGGYGRGEVEGHNLLPWQAWEVAGYGRGEVEGHSHLPWQAWEVAGYGRGEVEGHSLLPMAGLGDGRLEERPLVYTQGMY